MAQLSGDTDQGGPAVYGNNTYPTTEIDAWGGYFESTAGEGVRGLSHTVHGAVVGINDNSGPYADPPGPGGFFTSGLGEGVHGECSAEHGAVVGVNHGALRAGGPGGYFLGQTGDGVQGWSESQGHAGVRAVNEHGGPGLHATGALAALFEGDVVVTGDIKLAGADLAEGFRNRGDAVAPGSVMVLVGEDEVVASDTAYDRRAVGVVSGAEGYRPAVVLGNDGHSDRVPLALVGKVTCLVDADHGPVALGDLLVTSPTPGHAMRADDPTRTTGAVIGKAMGALESGRGLVPIVVLLG